MKKVFTTEQIKTINDLYLAGKHQWEIAATVGCAQTTISGILRRNKIPTRVGKKIIYTDLNTNYFTTIDTEEKAYFLGFLYADGCVQINNNAYTTTLKLEIDDKCMVEKFRDVMSPSSPVKTYRDKDGEYAYFIASQKIITEQLIALGCMPAKSLILQFPTPDQVPSHLLRHFLRGYSDGDGTITASIDKKRPYYSAYIWKIISTQDFCQATSNFLQQEIGISGSMSLSRPDTNNITTTLAIGGNNQVLKVLDWLYQDATIYLPRKYAKYQELQQFLATYNPNTRKAKRPDVNVASIIQDYQNGMYIRDIATKHRVSKWFVGEAVNKSGIPKRSSRLKS